MMKTYVKGIGIFTLLSFPLSSLAGTLDGYVFKGDTNPLEPITEASVQLLDPDCPECGSIEYLDINGDGSFSFSGLEDDREFIVEVIPFVPGADEKYVPQIIESVTVPSSGYSMNINLVKGYNISGTVNRPDEPTNPDDRDWYWCNFNVLNENNEFVTWCNPDWEKASPEFDDGSTNPDYSALTIDYTCMAVEDMKTYYVGVLNCPDYHDQFYDGVPAWAQYDRMAGNPIEVSGADVTNIDFNLISDTKEYYIKEGGPGTMLNRDSDGLSTFSFFWFEVGHLVKNYNRPPVFPSEVAGASLTINDTDTFTDLNSSFAALWMIRYNDNNGNGLIDEDERPEPSAESWSDNVFEFAPGPPHPAGKYELTVQFENTEELTKTLTGIPAGLTLAEFTPVTDLQASYDPATEEMEVSWQLPMTYPTDSTFEIRLRLFKNGTNINNRMRIRRLPSTATSFTFDSEMTGLFRDGRADQMRLEVRMGVGDNTRIRTRKDYTFNPETGSLTEAPIRTIFDVNGDGKTGLEETIHSLQVLSGQ